MRADTTMHPNQSLPSSSNDSRTVVVERSREAAERLWTEICRHLAGNPFASARAWSMGLTIARRA